LKLLPQSPRKPDYSGRNRERGFALLAVLWISLLLGLLALNYATTARLKAEAARNRRLAVRNDFILEAALARGWHEFLKYRVNRGLLRKKAEYEEITGAKLELWYPRREPRTAVVDGVKVEIRIVDEAGKFQINGLSVERLRKVVETCGLTRESARDVVVDSILDWTDGDSLHRLNGAETDYYKEQGLDYSCKNRPFEVVNELLLVRGVSPELYSGSVSRPGLVDFLSPYGTENGRLDINSCATAALRLIEELPEDVIADIVARRLEGPIENLADLSEIVPAEYFSQLQHWFIVGRSNYIMVAVRIAGPKGLAGGWRRRIYAINRRR